MWLASPFGDWVALYESAFVNVTAIIALPGTLTGLSFSAELLKLSLLLSPM